MKRLRWKAGASPPTERITLLHLEIKKLKVSGIAPDNTIYNLHKKTHEEKAVVCLIYIYIEPEKIFRHLQISS